MANWAQKLKLHHLQTLVALGEQGNLTHVARMMNISQPALSKWLSQLEDEIGITLFERHSKGLRPSEGGKLLLQHAQRLINDLERSQYEIARFKQGGLVGSLKIGCSPVATDCVSQAILSLLNEMPTLHLNIEEKVMTPLLHDLLAGQVDVVVGRVGGRALQLPLNYHGFPTRANLVQLFIKGIGQRYHRRLQQIVKYFAAFEVVLVGNTGQQQKRNNDYHCHQQRIQQRHFKMRRQSAGGEKYRQRQR